MGQKFPQFIVLFSTLFSFGLVLGQDLIVSDIVIDGNDKTKPFVILNELPFQKGDTLNAIYKDRMIEQAKVNVFNLRLFNQVEITPIPIEGEKFIILIEVIERWYVYPIPIFKLADPNFNTWWLTKDLSRTSYGMNYTHKNFRGRNETLRLRTQFGYNKNFFVMYTLPRYNKKRNLDLSILANYIDFREITVGTVDNERLFYENENGRDKRHFSLATSIKHRPTLYDYQEIRIGFNNINISDSLATTFPDHLNNSKTFLQYFDLRYSLGHIHVDNQAFPLRGDQWEFSFQLNGLDFVNNQNATADIRFAGSKFWEISKKWHIQNHLNVKYTAHDALPYTLQRGLGYGNINVRGYEYYIVDGQRYILGRNNVLFTLVEPRTVKLPLKSEKFNIFNYAIYLSTYLDLGYVRDLLYQEQNFLDNKLLAGSGIGINFYTVYDRVFRLEYSFNNINEQGIFLHYRKSI